MKGFTPQSSMQRGYNPAHTSDPNRQGDAGWGVARSEPRFMTFEKVWHDVMVNGVKVGRDWYWSIVPRKA